ncbi:hypothetical protein PG997_002177 [Apiospora hydei]|uniref:Uncharacterized protein n=1 Tax=Apiospora hydei TaxID=1337664 RepID=A0ABR1X8M5_9PEZI
MGPDISWDPNLNFRRRILAFSYIAERKRPSSWNPKETHISQWQQSVGSVEITLTSAEDRCRMGTASSAASSAQPQIAVCVLWQQQQQQQLGNLATRVTLPRPAGSLASRADNLLSTQFPVPNGLISALPPPPPRIRTNCGNLS